jgi:cyanophycinase
MYFETPVFIRQRLSKHPSMNRENGLEVAIEKSVTSCLIILFLSMSLVGIMRAQDIGPANGSLVIVGGALKDQTIITTFLDLAGGPEVNIVVIPTAGTGDGYDDYWSGLKLFREAGASNLTVLHTRDRRVADSDDFVQSIDEARGVWFSGGRQWRLADAYLHTKTHQALRDLLNRGGVIGGTSAGATIQGSYLVRGDTKTNTIMMGDHQEGMAFLKNVAIDQHIIKRNRHFDLIEVIKAHPELLGLGIDEDTAIIVQNDRFEVIGQGYVAIYDARLTLDSGGLFYFLAPGDRFDLKTRQAFRPTQTEKPLNRVVPQPWPKQE